MTTSDRLADGVLENFRQVRSRSHSCLGGSLEMSLPVILAVIRS